MHYTIFCGHSFANMYKLSVIVIDKSVGLGGTIYVYEYTSYICAISYITEIEDLKLITLV